MYRPLYGINEEVKMDGVKDIAVIRSSYSPYGGLEVQTADFIRSILAKNIKVSLLTLPRQRWLCSSESGNNYFRQSDKKDYAVVEI